MKTGSIFGKSFNNYAVILLWICIILIAVPFIGTTQNRPDKFSRALAWRLGSRLSIAALAYDRGSSEYAYKIVKKYQPVAELFHSKIPDFPTKTGKQSMDTAKILYYLLNTVQDSIGKNISAYYPRDHYLLFQIAIRTNILLIMYQPGSELSRTMADVIINYAPHAGLPYRLWSPVVKNIERHASHSELKNSVIQMQEAVQDFLTPDK